MVWMPGFPENTSRTDYLLTYLLHGAESFLKANWSAASQETPRISRNTKVHYRTHKGLPPVSILGQPNPVHIYTPNPLEIHSNIISPSTPRSPQLSPSLRFPHQDPIHSLSPSIRATCPAHLILDFITRTMLGEEYKSFSSTLCHLHSPVTSSLLSPNILLNTLSQTPSPSFPPAVSTTKFHTHTKQAKLSFYISCSLNFWIAA